MNRVITTVFGLVLLLPLYANASVQSAGEMSLRDYQRQMESALAAFWTSVNGLHEEPLYKVRCRAPSRDISNPKLRWWTNNRHLGCIPNFVYDARREILRDRGRIGVAHNLKLRKLDRQQESFLTFVEDLSEVHPELWEKLDHYLAAKAEFERVHLQRTEQLPKFNRLASLQ